MTDAPNSLAGRQHEAGWEDELPNPQVLLSYRPSSINITPNWNWENILLARSDS